MTPSARVAEGAGHHSRTAKRGEGRAARKQGSLTVAREPRAGNEVVDLLARRQHEHAGDGPQGKQNADQEKLARNEQRNQTIINIRYANEAIA